MVILWQSVIINRALLLKKTSFEVRFEAFLTGRRLAVFWKNGMKKFFFNFGRSGYTTQMGQKSLDPIRAIAGL